MALDAQGITEEILLAGDAEARQRAVAALAVIGSERSLRRLAELAVTDPDREVRERAAGEIGDLDTEQQATVTARLHSLLHEGIGEPRAYLLLARLRHQGIVVSGPRRELWRRLRWAFLARDHRLRRICDHPQRHRKHALPFQEIVIGLVVGALGAAVCLALIMGWIGTVDADAAVFLLLGSAALGALLAAAAADAEHVGWYFERRAGLALEVFAAMLANLVPMALLTVLATLFWPEFEDLGAARLAKLGGFGTASGLLFVVGLRAGAFLAPHREGWSQLRRWLLAFAASWLTGALVLTGLLAVLHAVGGSGGRSSSVAAGLWLLLLASGAAPAAIYARTEKLAPESRLLPPRQTWAILGLALIAVVLLWWTLPAPQPRAQPLLGNRELRPEPEIHRTPSSSRVPEIVDLDLGFAQVVQARLESESETELGLTLVDRKQKMIAFGPRQIDETLVAGKYQLIVERRVRSGAALHPGSEPRLARRYFGIARQLARFDPRGSPIVPRARVGRYRLRVTLNARPAAAFQALLSARLQDGSLAAVLETYDRAVEVSPQLDDDVEQLDKICRVGALTRLKSAPGGLDWRLEGVPAAAATPESLVSRLIEICDRAVARSGENGAVRESRALARMATGDRQGAIEDLIALREWTTDRDVVKERDRWIQGLLGGQAASHLFSQQELDVLLEGSRKRSVARLTRETAQTALAYGCDQLWDGDVPGGLSAFIQAAAIEARLEESNDFWGYLCWMGGLRGGASGAESVLFACEKAVELEGARFRQIQRPAASDQARLARALSGRGIVLAMSGRAAPALADFARAEELASEPWRRRWIESLAEGGLPGPGELEELAASVKARQLPRAPSPAWGEAP